MKKIWFVFDSDPQVKSKSDLGEAWPDLGHFCLQFEHSLILECVFLCVWLYSTLGKVQVNLKGSVHIQYSKWNATVS